MCFTLEMLPDRAAGEVGANGLSGTGKQGCIMGLGTQQGRGWDAEDIRFPSPAAPPPQSLGRFLEF